MAPNYRPKTFKTVLTETNSFYQVLVVVKKPLALTDFLCHIINNNPKLLAGWVAMQDADTDELMELLDH